jgi:predicted acylesterase/phospholipase RssA
MKHLAIGPGVLGYFALIGVLKNMADTARLDNLEEISGSSAGALVAFMYIASRGNFERLLDVSLNIPINKLAKPDLKTLIKSYGLVPAERVKGIFSNALKKLIPKKEDVTFEELYHYFPIKLHVAAFCLDLSRTIYFSVDTHPKMSVLDALYASIAVPFLFEALVYQDWRYIDGAFMEATPCAPFLNKQDVLAIHLVYKNLNDFNDLRGYVSMILSAVLKNRFQYTGIKHMNIDIGDSPVFNFNLSNEDKIRMYTLGYELATPVS